MNEIDGTMEIPKIEINRFDGDFEFFFDDKVKIIEAYDIPNLIEEMIGSLIEARETLLHINGHDAYGDFSEEITEIEKALKSAGCTDGPN